MQGARHTASLCHMALTCRRELTNALKTTASATTIRHIACPTCCSDGLISRPAAVDASIWLCLHRLAIVPPVVPVLAPQARPQGLGHRQRVLSCTWRCICGCVGACSRGVHCTAC